MNIKERNLLKYCEMEEELYEEYDSAVGFDFEQDALSQQGIIWEVIEINIFGFVNMNLMIIKKLQI